MRQHEHFAGPYTIELLPSGTWSVVFARRATAGMPKTYARTWCYWLNEAYQAGYVQCTLDVAKLRQADVRDLSTRILRTPKK